jgi:hypothetical protein
MSTKIDRRPDPKPRKLAQLYQLYQIWYELSEMKKKHILRMSSIEKEKSNMDMEIEKAFLEHTDLEKECEYFKKNMVKVAELIAGDIWSWLVSIRGLGEGGLAAQLLAQIDDISRFSNISKLWRFAGYAVIDGKAERNHQGEKSHKNNLLAAIVWNIGDQFIRQQTVFYSEIYYQEKARLRELYPVPIDVNSGSLWQQKYTDSHIHRMAKRKMEKIFLSHLWLKWRKAEGLPESAPYVIAILQHADLIEAQVDL